MPACRSCFRPWSRYYGKFSGRRLVEENLLETTGAGEAIFLAVTSLAAPGREVIVIEPSFVLFQPLVGLAGGSVRRIVTTAEKGYQVDPQEVIDAMGPRTCAVILNSPGNPTGAVYPASTVQAICQAAARRGITVISDEVYDRLVLDEMESPSVLNCDLDLDHLIVASSVSKTYSMPGMRVGWLISSRKNLQTLRRYHTYTTTVGNTPDSGPRWRPCRVTRAVSIGWPGSTGSVETASWSCWRTAATCRATGLRGPSTSCLRCPPGKTGPGSCSGCCRRPGSAPSRGTPSGNPAATPCG